MASSRTRMLIFKIVLGLYGVMALVPLGIMHVFFPDQYFRMISYDIWDATDPVQVEMVELIGSFFIAQALGAFLIISNPLRNRDLLIVQMAAMLMTCAVVVYTILIGVAPQVVWFNTIAPYTIMLAIFTATYPWRDAARYQGV